MIQPSTFRRLPKAATCQWGRWFWWSGWGGSESLRVWCVGLSGRSSFKQIPLVLSFSFYLGKNHECEIYHFNSLSIHFSGLRYILPVVPPSPPLVSRVLHLPQLTHQTLTFHPIPFTPWNHRSTFCLWIWLCWALHRSGQRQHPSLCIWLIHPWCSLSQNFFPFLGQTIFHGMCTPHYVYPFICGWTRVVSTFRLLCKLLLWILMHENLCLNISRKWKRKDQKSPYFPSLSW